MALEDTDFDIVLIDAAGEHADYPGVGSRPRLPLVQYFGIGIKRISRKNRCREFDFFPTEVGDGRLANIGHAHANDDGDSEWASNEGSAKFGLRGVFLIKVQWMCIHREQRKPCVVMLRDRPAGKMMINIAHSEVLEQAAFLVRVSRFGARFGHDRLPFAGL